MEKKGCSYKCDIAIYTLTLYMYIYYTCERVFGVGGFCNGMVVVGGEVSGTTLHPQIIDSSWPSPLQNKPGFTKSPGLLF